MLALNGATSIGDPNPINKGPINFPPPKDFDVVKKADWVVEAVVEKIDIKHNLYEKILKTRKKDSIISSNTSTIPLKVLSEKVLMHHCVEQLPSSQPRLIL